MVTHRFRPTAVSLSEDGLAVPHADAGDGGVTTGSLLAGGAPRRTASAARAAGGLGRIAVTLARWWGILRESSCAWLLEPRRAAARHETVATLGGRLVACQEPAALMDEAWLAVSQICRLTPGLRALAVTTADAGWRVTRLGGDFARIPMTSSSRLPEPPTQPVIVQRQLYDTYAFDVAAGQRCSWVAIWLPGAAADTWLIVGRSASTRSEAVVSLRAIAGLVSVALRATSRRHGLQHDAGGWQRDGLSRGNTGAPHGDSPTLAAQELNVEPIAEAVRRAGEEFIQQVSAVLPHPASAGTVADDVPGNDLARLASGMVQDISRQVSERLAASLAGTRAVDNEQTPPTEPAPLTRTFATEELRAAVAADEIVVRYQPIMSASGDGCTGVEALARWQHPRHGLLKPAQFLVGADDSEATRAIGTHVLRQAVAEGSKWRREFPEQSVPVHVNVSPDQLEDDGFATTVRDCLTESSLPASSLVLELTGRPASLSTSARAQLGEMAADGVQIAVSADDVDADEEQMTTWRELPVSIVKLDGRAITDDIGARSPGRPESIVEMARRLGLRTVAERVEDVDQQQRLRVAGADSTQGYLHTEPVRADAVSAWLTGARGPVASGAAGSRPA